MEFASFGEHLLFRRTPHTIFRDESVALVYPDYGRLGMLLKWGIFIMFASTGITCTTEIEQKQSKEIAACYKYWFLVGQGR